MYRSILSMVVSCGILSQLIGCTASLPPFSKVPDAKAYYVYEKLPIDGGWSGDTGTFILESGVLSHRTHSDPNYLNKAVIIGITRTDNGVYEGKCFNYTDKAYNLPCRIEVFKPNTLGVTYRRSLIHRLRMDNARDSLECKAEVNASLKHVAVLDKYSQCAGRCKANRERCGNACLTKGLGSLSLDTVRNNMVQIEAAICGNRCDSDKDSCLGECSDLLD